jgi:uncharacterized protein with HEPN domain
MRRDDSRLEDINNAAIRLAQYVAGVTLEQFLDDNMRRAATIREMEIMGEAAYRISEKLKVNHPEVPWAVLMNLRNFYIHVYDRIDYERVWYTVTHTVPRIQVAVSKLLPPPGEAV